MPLFYSQSLALGAASIAIFPAIVMLLWNLTLPDLFGVKKINYWRAVGLYLLCGILFGGVSIFESTKTVTSVESTETPVEHGTSRHETTSTNSFTYGIY